MRAKILLSTSLLAALIFSFFVGCKAKESKQEETVVSPQLNSSMQQLKTALTELLPLVMDPVEFNKPHNHTQIDKQVSKIAKLTQAVEHNKMMTELDPSLRFISSAFSQDLERVQESLASGKREYGRYLLMNVTSYCIECHTRTSTGPSFKSPEFERTLSGLKPLDRGEYLLATRQYERALEEFQAVIKNELSGGKNMFNLDKAVRYALAVAIKFQRDPKKASEIAKLISQSKEAPYYLRQNAESWQSAIANWLKEPKKSLTRPAQLLQHCRELVRKGQQFQLGADRGGDVYFMRALSDLHLLLAKSLSREELGEALFLTGISYESVRDLSVWSLHENYFESCIRQVPHSGWSARCYKRLEESVMLGFTGSSGVHMPMDAQMKLHELQKLALP